MGHNRRGWPGVGWFPSARVRAQAAAAAADHGRLGKLLGNAQQWVLTLRNKRCAGVAATGSGAGSGYVS